MWGKPREALRVKTLQFLSELDHTCTNEKSPFYEMSYTPHTEFDNPSARPTLDANGDRQDS